MKSYQHHIRDFNNATRHLNRLERSIYRDMIELYYDTEEPLTLDFELLCRKVMARSHEERTAVEQVLNEFFNETPNGWWHSVCDEVILDFRGNTSQKSEAGKASARKRAERRLQMLDRRSTVVQQTFNENPTKPETINHKPETNIKHTSTGVDQPDPVTVVFEYWKVRMNHPGAKLDDKRKKAINNALKLKYSVGQLLAAIDGCAKSPWHMGKDPRNNKIFDALTLILRDAEHIDGFIKTNISPPPGSNQTRHKTLEENLTDRSWAFGSETNIKPTTGDLSDLEAENGNRKPP